MKNITTILVLAALLVLSACSKVTPGGNAVTVKAGCTYRGGTADGLPDGYGVLARGDSAVYSGQWKAGKRHGTAAVTDPQGRTVTATFRADTVVSGTVADSLGTYQGELDSLYRPSGHGIYRGRDGSYYDGAWREGKRNGFGCGITAKGKVQTGEWKDGVYRGERMTYTAERIYGIDISRYQHGKGRKKYAIHWNKLRINHLGNISRKKVSGKVDYPVSFVYIKSTEGASVRNPYYLSDYRSARRYKIPVGAYHFFSYTSTAQKQAQYFLRHSRFTKGDLPPVLDVEPTAWQIRKMGGVQAMFGAYSLADTQDGRSAGHVQPHTHVARHRSAAHRGTSHPLCEPAVRKQIPARGTRPDARLHGMDSPLRRIQARSAPRHLAAVP